MGPNQSEHTRQPHPLKLPRQDDDSQQNECEPVEGLSLAKEFQDQSSLPLDDERHQGNDDREDDDYSPESQAGEHIRQPTGWSLASGFALVWRKTMAGNEGGLRLFCGSAVDPFCFHASDS